MIKKLISYNLNGIRAAIAKDFISWLKAENPDIICIQEIKANKEQLDTIPFDNLGYHQYWFSAQKKGYSGTAIFTKLKPNNVTYGIGIEQYDNEGRFLRADFENLILINSYFPSGTMGDVRQAVKMNYLYAIYDYIKKLLLTNNNIIISGDYNICHKPIDINHPELHQTVSGFLPEEREWFDKFIDLGLVDTFRIFNNEPFNYSWWSYRQNSRQKNLGWRIDYNIVGKSLEHRVKTASILTNVIHSDHCPVVIEIDF
jgi:exodeoxyribonuclease III